MAEGRANARCPANVLSFLPEPRHRRRVDLRSRAGFLGLGLMSLSTALGRLRFIGLCEGWSFVILLLVAMPLKYLAGEPLAVRVVGMGHGVLFLLLLAAALQTHFEENWPFRRTGLVMLGALLPFGPFVVDARILKPLCAR